LSPSTPPGGVTGELAAPAVGALGCEVGDYAGADLTGKIAIVSRGTCSFAQKSLVAGAVNAEAVLVYNNTSGMLNGTLGTADPAYVPAGGMTQADGQAVVAQ